MHVGRETRPTQFKASASRIILPYDLVVAVASGSVIARWNAARTLCALLDSVSLPLIACMVC